MEAMDHELIELEEHGWQALRAGGGSAIAFFDSVLDLQVTMLLPRGVSITSRPVALKAMSGTPWDSYHLGNWAVRNVTEDLVLLTYAVDARRGVETYAALVASMYIRRPGGWRLTFHQHTPR